MTNALRNEMVSAQGQTENAKAQNLPVAPEKKTGMSTVDKLVWGSLLVGFVLVVVYQVFFCPTCYVGGGRVVG